jgi:6-phosphogluconate dehydrogenase
MMEAVAEGFELIAAKEEFEVDLAALAQLWQHGSVIRSWLLELAANVYQEDANLEWIEPYVPDSGEGRWTVEESIYLSIPVPVIALALQMRFRSRQDNSHAARLLAALRNQFGGHAIKRPEE